MLALWVGAIAPLERDRGLPVHAAHWLGFPGGPAHLARQDPGCGGRGRCLWSGPYWAASAIDMAPKRLPRQDKIRPEALSGARRASELGPSWLRAELGWSSSVARAARMRHRIRTIRNRWWRTAQALSGAVRQPHSQKNWVRPAETAVLAWAGDAASELALDRSSCVASRRLTRCVETRSTCHHSDIPCEVTRPPCPGIAPQRSAGNGSAQYKRRRRASAGGGLRVVAGLSDPSHRRRSAPAPRQAEVGGVWVGWRRRRYGYDASSERSGQMLTASSGRPFHHWAHSVLPGKDAAHSSSR